jgi:hypothetical protein
LNAIEVLLSFEDADELLVQSDSGVQPAQEGLFALLDGPGQKMLEALGDTFVKRPVERLDDDRLRGGSHADTVSTRAASNAARNWT